MVKWASALSKTRYLLDPSVFEGIMIVLLKAQLADLNGLCTSSVIFFWIFYLNLHYFNWMKVIYKTSDLQIFALFVGILLYLNHIFSKQIIVYYMILFFQIHGLKQFLNAIKFIIIEFHCIQKKVYTNKWLKWFQLNIFCMFFFSLV